jgi:MarR family transcriptional regulator, organic hydroperoxide resistance regulator
VASIAGVFALTNTSPVSYLARMTVEETIRIVQTAYPQIYLACHTRHQRKRTTPHELSSRDSAILSHLDPVRAIAPAELARHLSIGRSTMSEALKRLVTLGYVERRNTRSAAAVLSQKGSRAIRDTSVLETARLEAAVSRVSPADRRLICRGLERLARACRALSARSNS